ncbi:MAG: lysophospholipid acyltransferase family protein [Thermodesulfobacteriota bacterium]
MTVYSIITIMVLAVITPMALLLAALFSLVDRSGDLAHLVARVWARLLVWSSFVRVKVVGRENLDPRGTYVFAANHSSAFDILVLLAYLPIQFRWLAKEELFRIPVFGPVMGRIGYIPVNRSNPREGVRSLERAAEKIRAGASVIIFPEGTRSPDEKIGPFKRGGFTLAVKSGRPVVPVSISGASKVLVAKTLKLHPGRIRIVLDKPMPTEGLERDRPGQDRLLERVREVIVGNHDPELGRRP